MVIPLEQDAKNNTVRATRRKEGVFFMLYGFIG
jgi:hypothetical protein